MLAFSNDYVFLLGAICILIGFFYAFFLYFRNSNTSFYLKRVLFSLRLILVSLIAFLLLNPLIKTIIREYEKPIVIIAQDVSESVQSDSIYLNVSMLADKLSSDFEIFPFHFSENLNKGFMNQNSGKITNYSKPIDLIYNQFFKQNVAAVILATDGIYNYGSNPLYSDKLSDFPYYTIAYGDTVQKKDIGIDKVRHNDITFLGNVTTLKVGVAAHGFKGSKTNLNIFHKKELIQSTEVSFLDNQDFQILEFAFEPKQIGLQKYTISLDSIPLDYTSSNNMYDIFIEVIDSRYKVLLLVDDVHPDIAAFKNVIETNKQLNIIVKKLSEFEGNLDSYHLIVCAGFNTRNISVIDKINKSNIPVLLIAGTDPKIFNVIYPRISINKINGFHQVSSFLNSRFSIFTLSDRLEGLFIDAPPLYMPFAEYKLSESAQVILKQQIGGKNTDQPIVFLDEYNGRKIAMILAEGFWQLKLHDFSKNLHNQAFNEFFNKITNYLLIQEDKSRFRISLAKKITEIEPLILEAQLYNDSYELVNDKEIELLVTHESGRVYDFYFSRNGESYSLNAGVMPVGEYVFKAIVEGEEKIKEGAFTVVPLQLEKIYKRANHTLLFQLSELTEAQMYYPNDIKDLIRHIKESKKNMVKIHTTEKLDGIINIHWILVVLLLLLLFEWGLRRYNGLL